MRVLPVTVLLAAAARAALSLEPCVGGQAGGYPCRSVDLRSFVPLATYGAAATNDVWGWVDPGNGDEYVLLGCDNGTAFIRITNPDNPVYVGKLPLHSGAHASSWRDLEVYQDHVFVVSDSAGPHGMQVFDLRQLRGVSGGVTFGETAWYDGGDLLRSAHTIAIDVATGYAYACGGFALGKTHGGPQIIDIRTPTSPVFVRQFDDDGYTHDAHCAVYHGPDAAYAGHEVCFCSNEDTVTLVDVTDHASPSIISRTTYPGVGYTHQGWLTEDHHYFLLDDELDESQYGHNTRTRIFDMANLAAPQLIGIYDGPTTATDHNLYVKGAYVYESNYRAGLRILSLAEVGAGRLSEAAYFDVVPGSDAVGYAGTWANYPYFPSGNVAVASIESGVFIVRPNLQSYDADVDGSGLVDGYDLILLGFSFGRTAGDPLFNPRADIDGSGVVDGNDLAILTAAFGKAA
ncbi:MAG: choice-of-anchor B family protein [Acidobacteriota bacterium]